MNPSARLREVGGQREWPEVHLPDEGVQELLHEAKYYRRNVEDSHSALQEMQACLAAETDERDHLSRVGDELNERIVLQNLLGESPVTVGFLCPLARTPVGDRGVSSRVPEHHQGLRREDR